MCSRRRPFGDRLTPLVRRSFTGYNGLRRVTLYALLPGNQLFGAANSSCLALRCLCPLPTVPSPIHSSISSSFEITMQPAALSFLPHTDFLMSVLGHSLFLLALLELQSLCAILPQQTILRASSMRPKACCLLGLTHVEGQRRGLQLLTNGAPLGSTLSGCR